MIHVKKSKKKRIVLLSLLAAFIVILAAVLIINALSKEEDDGKDELVKPDINEELGESLYGNMAIAYPSFEADAIDIINVSNKNGDYTVYRNEKNELLIAYVDSYGNTKVYYPDIAAYDSQFKYDSLYSIEGDDGFGTISKLSYLCIAIQYLYFDERIPLADSAEERALQFEEYGLTSDVANTISFMYLTEDGKEVVHSVRIGSNLVTGGGYYYMVDDRPYVYSTNVNYLDYALCGFAAFINPRLVIEGLEEDNAFAPYLTTDFKEWVNTMYDKEGEEVKEDSTVIVYADTLLPLYTKPGHTVGEGERDDGYSSLGKGEITFDLADLKKNPAYARLVSSLIGKKVAEDEALSIEDHIILTLVSDSRWIEFEDKDSFTYSYEITAIEAILTDGEDIIAEGTPIVDGEGNLKSNLIKVTYNYKIDGEAANGLACHAVIDLSSTHFDGVREDISKLSIGTLDEADRVEVEIVYSTETAVKRTVEVIITEIVAVYDATEYTEKAIVDENSIVSYRYTYKIDGKENGVIYSTAVDLSKDTSETGQKIKAVLLGKSAAKDLKLSVYTSESYSEAFSDFSTYDISKISYFFTKELIASYRFVNSSERDPFYGESIYENTLENKYRIYAINASTCQSVSKVLGGIGDTTTVANGLIGLETLAVGLTPQVMKQYGLYAYTVYFEMPRGIIEVIGDDYDEDDISDYTWYSTMGFTLYVSEEQPDGTRFVGSDMYDIVAKVDGASFEFLDFSFTELWARKALMMFEVSDVTSLDLEFNMTDVYGSYDFDLEHKLLYIASNGKAYTNKDSVPEGAVVQGTFDRITVNVSESGDCIETELSRYMETKGYDSVSLTELYNHTVGNGGEAKVGNDTAGAAYFKTQISIMFMSTYEAYATEEEQEAALSGEYLMRMRFKLSAFEGGKSNQYSDYYYVYEFYRISDRRVMVRIYQEDDAGKMKGSSVSDFCLSTTSFKKIVNGYLGVLNGIEIDENDVYTDVK